MFKFTEDPRCQQISEKVYVFKNVIPKEILDPIKEELSTYEKGSLKNLWSVRDWYEDKMSPPLMSTFALWKFMSELIYPELVIHPVRNIMITNNQDEGMFVHTDSPGKGNCSLLMEIDQWSTCCELEFGYVAYLGEFTGGQVYYPNINPDGTIKKGGTDITKARIEEPCLEFQPEEGDLVLHGACSPYHHGTRATTSGTRYAFSTFSLLAQDNPGTFYNYKTPEWEKQVGSGTEQELTNWNQPLRLNPQFKELIDEKLELYSKAYPNFEKPQE